MKKQVYAYLHTHWDREWYRDKEDFNLRFLEVFDIVLDELKNNKAPFFYLDGQTIALLDYLKFRPDKKDEITDLIKNQKLAIGPYFVSADSFLVNFCAMLKNLDLGLNLSKEFGQKDFIGYMSDIFGVSKSAFSALKLKNIDKALIWRGVNPEKTNNCCDFIKNEIKTTWLVQGYFNDFFHSGNIDGIKNYLDKIAKYSSKNLLMSIGADHLGMLQDANKKINEINKKLDNYEIILTSPFEYFKNTEFKNICTQEEFLDNSHTYILPGVYSARIYQKIKNTEVQNKLSRIVEVMNFYLKDKYDENIDFVWKTLIKNHAHDGIYGCSLDSVHRTIDARLEKCENALNAILKRLVGNFRKKYDLRGHSSDKIGVFNLSNYNNIKTVEIKLPYILKNSQVIKQEEGFCDELLYDIYKIPVTEDITPIYTQLIEISSNKKFEFNTVKIKTPKKKVIVSEKSIENDFIKLFIKNKKIKIQNKKTNESFEVKITDTKDFGDSYNEACAKKSKTLELLKTKIIRNGNIQSSLRLCFKDIELDVSLLNRQKFLNFETKINNKTKNHKIELVLTLNKNIEQTVSQEAFGIIKRKIDFNYKIDDFMPALRPFELKTNSYPMQNFVCANGAIALTKGLHEYKIYKNELKICLLRCFSTISNPKNKTRSIPAGPDLKTPEGQCLGKNNANFALLFGDYKNAFSNLDEFFKNYVMIDYETKKEFNLKLDEIPPDYYIYGINEGKKIGYNLKKNNISLI